MKFSSLTPQSFENHDSRNSISQSIVQYDVAETKYKLDEEINLRDIFRVFRRRIKSLIGVSAVVGIAFYAWTATRPPVFQGSFSLLVEPVNRGTQLGTGLQLSSPSDSDSLDYQSQVLILKSELVLVPILDKLNMQLPDLTLGRLRGGMSIQRDGTSKILNVTYRSENADEINIILDALKDGFVAYSVDDRQKELRINRELVAEQVQVKQQEVAESELRLESFQRRFNLVDPDQASALVTQRINTTLSEIQANNINIKSAQARFDNLQAQIGLSPSEAIVASNLSEAPVYQNLLTQFRDLESEIALESARYRMDSPVVQALVDKRNHLLPLLQAEADRILGRTLASEVGTNAQSLGFQGTVGLNLVQQFVNTVNEIEVLQARSQALDQGVSELVAELDALSVISREYNEIQRELSIAENNLSLLLETYEKLGLEIVRQTQPWRIVSSLEKNQISEIKPGFQQFILMALFSTISGVGFVFLLEKLDRAYHSVEDISSESNLPILSTIPFDQELKHSSIRMGVPFVTSVEELLTLSRAGALEIPKVENHDGYYGQPFEEAFFSLEANLRLLNADARDRVYVISSCRSGEGKTTIAAHLAIAASKVGRKVLLVDADLRSPSIHRYMSLSNHSGLVEYLASSENPEHDSQSLNSQIKGFAQNPNLFVLTAGERPPAPTRLLSSEKFSDLLKEVSESYDLVIIDTPPMINFADAKLILSHADGLILTTRLGMTNRDDFSKSISDLVLTSRSSILGIVINGVKSFSKDYYYSYYAAERE